MSFTRQQASGLQKIISSGSLAYTFPSAPGNSRLITVCVWGFSGTFSLSGCSDNKGNTFNGRQNPIQGGSINAAIYDFTIGSSAGYTSPYTVTVTNPGSACLGAFDEWSVTNVPPSIDVSTSSTSSTNGTSGNSGTTATTNANCGLAVAVLNISSSSATSGIARTDTTNWAVEAVDQDGNSDEAGEADSRTASTSSTTLSDAWTWTPSATYAAAIATYKEAAGGAQDTPELYGRPDGLSGQRQMHQLLAQ